MSSGDQQGREKGGKREEGLPTESSPYTQYKDLEDYKRQGYGTEGHQQPQSGRGAAASTDAPTVAGGHVSSQSQLSPNSTNRKGTGVP